MIRKKSPNVLKSSQNSGQAKKRQNTTMFSTAYLGENEINL